MSGASSFLPCISTGLQRLRPSQQIRKSLSSTSAAWPTLTLPSSPSEQEVSLLCSFITNSSNLTVLTGAGISTPSGIPDYRGPSGSYKLGHKPMTHTEFMTNEANRKRFWARSMVGWQTVAAASPNDAHIALVSLEQKKKLHTVITQNVDRLHHKAGSQNIIDLHGRVDRVRCQCCQKPILRTEWQSQLVAANGHFLEQLSETQRQMRLRRTGSAAPTTTGVRADGDAELGLEDYSQMNVPSCVDCGGIIKLDVVMFGDNVPGALVERAYEQVTNSDALLVVGTSLEVFSAYRFVNHAHQRGMPIAIVNFGETRAERLGLSSIRYKSEANCAELLRAVAERI